jgi:hypothetical protein
MNIRLMLLMPVVASPTFRRQGKQTVKNFAADLNFLQIPAIAALRVERHEAT